MARRGENIRKRTDGRWEGRYKNGFTPTGKIRYSSVYGKSYTEAKRKLLTAKTTVRQADAPPVTSEMNFEQLLIQWLNTNRVRLKGSTKSKYLYLTQRHIIPGLGNLRLSELSSEAINGFLERKLASGKLAGTGGLSPAYVKGMAIVIGAALRFAESEGLYFFPKIAIYKPQQLKKDIEILSKSDQRAVEKAILRQTDETRIGILLALHAGLRIGEICALSWDDVDLINATLHIRHTVSRVTDDNAAQKTRLIIDTPKTKTSLRDIPMTSVLLEILKKARQTARSIYVVSTEKDFVSTRTFDYRYRKAMRDIGVTPINFHALRHTFATRCIETNMDVKTLSEILGHASTNITLNTYVHSSMDLKRRQIEKLCAR